MNSLAAEVEIISRMYLSVKRGLHHKGENNLVRTGADA